MFKTVTEFDFLILNFIHEKTSCAVLDAVMPIITLLGSGGAVWIAAAVIMLCSKRYRRTGTAMLAALACSWLFGNLLLKNIAARERPCWINTNITMLIAVPADYSFPSGHTFSSFAAATVLYRTDKRLGAAAYILAALIGFSRLYLYVHFPSDVLAGALLGILTGYLAAHYTGSTERHT